MSDREAFEKWAVHNMKNFAGGLDLSLATPSGHDGWTYATKAAESSWRAWKTSRQALSSCPEIPDSLEPDSRPALEAVDLIQGIAPLPCPFCGSSDVGGAAGIVSCYRCDAEIAVQNTNTHYAVQLWNRRNYTHPASAQPVSVPESQNAMDKHFPFNGDYRKTPKTKLFCAMCQKDIKPSAYIEHVFLGDPADHVKDPLRLDGDEIKVPIGPECAKKIPAGYRVTEAGDGIDNEST